MAGRGTVYGVGLGLVVLVSGGAAAWAAEALGPFREVDPSLKRARELSAEGRLVDAIRAIEAEPALLERPDALLLRAECVVELIQWLDPAASSRDGRSVRLRPQTEAEVRREAVPLLLPGEPVRDRREHDWQWFREGYQAVDDCRAVLAADPVDARAHSVLAALLMAADEEPELTAEVIDEAVRLVPDDVEVRLSRVAFCAASRTPDDAREELRAIGKEFPANWRFFCERSDLGLRLGDPLQSLFDAEAAVELAPDPAGVRDARRQLLAAMLGNEQWEEAVGLIDVQLADAAIAGEARRFEHQLLLCRRGTANLELGRYEQALADLDREAALDPDAPGLHLRRGAVYRVLGRAGECIEEYRLASRAQPYSLTTRELCLSLLDRPEFTAERLREEKFVQWLQSWKYYQKTGTQLWTHPPTAVFAARLLQEVGLIAESVEYCDRAIAVGDKTGTGYRLRAKARLAAGDAQAALADAERAVADGAAAAGGGLEARAVRAEVYLAVGRLAEAADDYEAAGAFGEDAARALRGGRTRGRRPGGPRRRRRTGGRRT